MDQVQLIGELLRSMRRRAVILVLVMAIGIPGSIYYALGRPSLYETSAKILIESQQIPDDLARSTVNLSAAERLQLIEQRLMARDNLITVIDELGLFADTPDLPVTNKVAILREAIRIERIAGPGQTVGNGGGIFAVAITARLGDPDQAAAVVNEFVDSAVEQNLQVRAERVRDTLAYFEVEEARVGEALAELEARIAVFKRENEGTLPESLEFRRDELRRLQQRDIEIDASLLGLAEQRGALALALVGERPGAATGLFPRSPEETELRAMELELAQKLRVLGPSHPDIRRLRDQIEAVDALVVPPSPEDTAVTSGLSEAQASTMRRQIAQLDSQMALLNEQKAGIEERNAVLEASIRETPEVEIALGALTRRFAELREQYDVIARGRAEASTGEQLETNQQSERFHVVERALVPEHPVEPNRKKLVVLGSGASVGLAMGLVVLLEILNPVLRNSAQMERRLNLRPVISIPYVATPWERRRRRLAWIGGFFLIAAGLALATQLIDKQAVSLRSIGESIELEKYFGMLGIES